MEKSLIKVVSGLVVLMATLAIATLVSGETLKTMKCTLTGKEVKTCCCEERPNGKMFCKLAKKEIDKCCCEGM